MPHLCGKAKRGAKGEPGTARGGPGRGGAAGYSAISRWYAVLHCRRLCSAAEDALPAMKVFDFMRPFCFRRSFVVQRSTDQEGGNLLNLEERVEWRVRSAWSASSLLRY